MRKLGVNSIKDIANPLLELANIGGEDLLRMVSVGLTMGGALETIVAFIAPEIALGVAAVGTIGGMLMEYLRGRKQKQMAEAMASNGLTPEGPAFICGERGGAELELVRQQALENGR